MPLVFVPTPLGNLRDITLRALDVLRECDLLVAEDSRVARKLLSALQLPGREIWTYHEHNARSVTPEILQRARDGLIAVVTDAGTPGISDPGAELVAAARAQQVPVEVLPGPSALIGAAVLSGFALREFHFGGFLPRAKNERRRALLQALCAPRPSVWYESPQRILATLGEIGELEPARPLFVLREYTKMYEEQLAGTAAQILERLAQPVRGEIVLVLDAGSAPLPEIHEAGDVDAAIDELLAEKQSVSAIAKALADRGFGERRHLYARTTVRKQMRKDAGALPETPGS